MYYLYILRSTTRAFSYIGTTNNLQRRVQQHNLGYSKSTKSYHPFKLVHVEQFESLTEARKREWYLKCTPEGGKEKKRLIAGG